MPRPIPPEIIEKIKREKEGHQDNRIPIYLPDDHIPTRKDQDREPEETSGVYIIDLVD